MRVLALLLVLSATPLFAADVINITSTGAVCDGSTDDTTAIQTAHNNLPASGGTIVIPVSASGCVITNTIAISKPNVIVTGSGAGSLIHQTGSAKKGFYVTADRFRMNGIRLQGRSGSHPYTAGEIGVHIYSATDALIDGNEIFNWGFYGVLIEGSSSSRNVISGNHVHNIAYGGISMYSGKSHTITRNRVIDINATGAGNNGYGISVSNATDTVSGAAANTRPYATDVLIEGNDVEQVENWTGIDAHGGERIRIANNRVSDVRIGIHTGLDTSAASNPVLNDVTIIGNQLFGTSSDTNSNGTNNGIVTVGASSTARIARVRVIGNVVKGFNTQRKWSSGGGAVVYWGDDVLYANNLFAENLGNGIFAQLTLNRLQIVGNTFVDNYKDTAAGVNGIGIYLYPGGATISGDVSGNVARWTGDTSHTQEWGIRAETACDVTANGNNFAGNSAFEFVNKDYLTRSFASSIPTSGTWTRGQIIHNTNPSELGTGGSKYVITGWICVVSGAPGTWVETRTLTGN